MDERYGKTLIYATPLHYAAYFGHFEIVQILLENGARLRERNLLGETALCIAIKKGHCQIFKYLIQKGADIDVWREMCGPVIIAIIHSQIDVLKLLLKHGAEVNFQHFEYRTPLQYAIKNQNLEMIHELLTHDANPNFSNENQMRFPALKQALKTGNLEIIKLLVNSGAIGACFLYEAIKSTNAIDNVKMLLQFGLEVNGTHEDIPFERTPLHIAIIKDYGNLEIVTLLIQYGADVNAKDEELQTPLHYAFKYKVLELKLLKILMLNGANPYLKDDEGESTIERSLNHNATNYFKVILCNQHNF